MHNYCINLTGYEIKKGSDPFSQGHRNYGCKHDNPYTVIEQRRSSHFRLQGFRNLGGFEQTQYRNRISRADQCAKHQGPRK
jgi:hypothetical protein